MANFDPTYYIKFDDPNNTMVQALSIGCSLCWYDEVEWVAKNAPQTIGNIVKAALVDNPAMTEDDIEALVEAPLDAWQEVDDYNSENGIPTFLCYDCYDQLKNEEIHISEILSGGEH